MLLQHTRYRLRDTANPNLKENTVFPRRKIESHAAARARRGTMQSLEDLVDQITKTIRANKDSGSGETLQPLSFERLVPSQKVGACPSIGGGGGKQLREAV
jgi:hypothetical protein